jgi:hypothetical protein
MFSYVFGLVKAVLKKREYGSKYTKNNFITGVRAMNEFCLKPRYSNFLKCSSVLCVDNLAIYFLECVACYHSYVEKFSLAPS